MSYRLEVHKPVAKSVNKVIADQAEKAIEEASSPKLSTEDQVHQLRKRCKKIRAALRFIRPYLGGKYSRENRWYRDTARLVAGFRDADVNRETLGLLIKRSDKRKRDSDVQALYRMLDEHRSKISGKDVDARGQLDKAIVRLKEGLARMAEWDLPGDTSWEEGVGKTLGRARRGMKRAFRTKASQDFHEWRKRVKYHGYHCRLLLPAEPRLIGGRRECLDDLAEVLGQEHDLGVLESALGRALEKTGFDALISESRSELRSRARRLGLCLFGEKTDSTMVRLSLYWQSRANMPEFR